MVAWLFFWFLYNIEQSKYNYVYRGIFLFSTLAVDCGPLLSPLNGDVSFTSTTFLSEADYSCNIGYIRMGVVSRICQADRDWSNMEPTCDRKFNVK